MADPREDIMAQLLILLGQMSGMELVARNLDEIPDTKMDSIVLYDGDEVADDNPRAVGGKPNIVRASPQIIISLGDVPENIGTRKNERLTEVKRLILLDDTLQTLCGEFQTCGAHYAGAETSLKKGRTTTVELSINFIISYHFKPYDL